MKIQLEAKSLSCHFVCNEQKLRNEPLLYNFIILSAFFFFIRKLWKSFVLCFKSSIKKTKMVIKIAHFYCLSFTLEKMIFFYHIEVDFCKFCFVDNSFDWLLIHYFDQLINYNCYEIITIYFLFFNISYFIIKCVKKFFN